MRIMLGKRIAIDIYRPRISLINDSTPKDIKKNILVACFPKSGSTYLVSLLKEIIGFDNVGLTRFYGHNEQDLYEPILETLHQIDTVTQQHVKGTENNITLIKKYNLIPIVLTRNIYDVVLSIYDHIEREDHRGPSGYIHKQYFDMDREDRLMFLIRMLLPWYFNFFMSWQESSRETNVLWISYEELFSNQIETISKILTYCSIPVDVEKIESAISVMGYKDTRFNVGKSGRGQTLPASHKEAILDLARVWKVDNKIMETIGISL